MAEAALFKEIHFALQQEDYVKVVEICNRIRATHSKDSDAIKIKCIALIRLEKFDKALEVAEKHAFLNTERAYCLYRLKRNEAALSIVHSCSDQEKLSPSLLHVEAQVEYCMENYQKSLEIYQGLQQDVNMTNEEEVSPLELQANFLAARESKGLLTLLHQRSELDNLDKLHYEVAFNKAFYHINNQDWDRATTLLLTAEKLWQEALVDEGLSEVQIQNELAPLKAQIGFVRFMTGDIDEALSIYQDVLRSSKLLPQTVATNNIIAIRQDRDYFNALKRLKAVETNGALSKMTTKQQNILQFNRALLLCLLNKHEECLEYIQALLQRFPDFEKLSGILAMLTMQASSITAAKALSILQAESSVMGGLCHAHVLLVKGSLEDAAQRINSIENIRNLPGTVATLVNIYEVAENLDAAQAVLDAALEYHKSVGLNTEAAAKIMEGRCSFLLKMKRYEEAAAAYTEFLELKATEIDSDTRMQSLASLVICLSHVDPAEAERRCAFLPAIDSVCDADPLALEVAAPRNANRTSKSVDVNANIEVKRTKNPERVARKRAKRREAYLAKLRARHDYNATIGLLRPDPERWIPRKQRSFGKRGRRGRTRISGAQGAGNLSEREAMRLDAAARSAAKLQGDAQRPVAVVQSQTAPISRKAKKKKRR